jgi:hypothetical protein
MTVLSLATLGGVTEIGSFQSLSHHLSWPRQVTDMCLCCWNYHAKLRKWKHSLKAHLHYGKNCQKFGLEGQIFDTCCISVTPVSAPKKFESCIK